MFFIIAGGSFSIFDLNGVSVRGSYTINQGYIFALRCGIFGSLSPTGDTFKWFDSNENEGKKAMHVFIT